MGQSAELVCIERAPANDIQFAHGYGLCSLDSEIPVNRRINVSTLWALYEDPGSVGWGDFGTEASKDHYNLALELRSEWVMITPPLQVGRETLVARFPFVDDDTRFIVIVVPPLIDAL